ncbi:MAG: Acetyltransferase GNAT family protein [Candidatus Yanofskybacteria bacterium GW2011_GWF1_44_227]|uniref:Acetyltransferase GNAT family protein n=1 Tax=Candidatus Yanofskybacteria bacterium GW2011_GWE2_40_11 TaxID=1619033 RepID=A0A0G0QLC7_9BACT|nr:MAG: Acetyltransferase GNAT family protein [Candidatus Yanofskybacteria bacterium GW2011_GWE1_40_10]KKR41229.1 MAG: Acetyltransferase GNAT family protein [Candidatus Yanofskybacteria bacterium GW2011_GWE2_40_11]KKT15695.1 MAG: Acetyltransferase GNAT family protein [Candidatus Yanofskybacteria bacterium GW2011_GWF2_43_596]KKT53417.1 MAG: Acetyltransferase GNAT family protein [Candidatus Yanofskybacteria bacterium GW2011_GWF1_44_227]HAU08041.1 N-acetyltransferase [Candidatus Yanofskybacteria b
MESQPSRPIFIVGHKTILRPIELSDVPQLLVWANDPEIRQFIARYRPVSEKYEKEWVEKSATDETKIVFMIEEKTSRKAIGVMGLHRINWKDRSCTTGAYIGQKDLWGKGYGTDAKMFLLDYAFNTLNLRRIESAAYEYNKRSIHYSLHCGYKIEGRKRKAKFSNGRYWDDVLLALFKKEWLPIWKRYKKTGKIK